MKCELFFSYEKNIDFENIKKHLEGFPEQNQIITDNYNLHKFLKKNKINSKMMGELIPDDGNLAKEIFEKAKNLQEGYRKAFSKLTYKKISIFSGFDNLLFRQLIILFKAEKILQNKRDTIFIFKEYFPIFFVIKKRANEMGYNTIPTIGIIEKNKIGTLNITNTEKLQTKLSQKRSYNFLKNSIGKNFSLKSCKIIFTAFIDITGMMTKKMTYNLLNYVKINSNERLMEKICKKTKSQPNLKVLFFVTTGREDLYLKPWNPVLKLLGKSSIIYQIFTNDLATSNIIRKENLPFMNLFSEVKILEKEIERFNLWIKINSEINEIVNGNSSILGMNELLEYFLKQTRRTLSLILILENIIKTSKIESIVAIADGEMLENIAVEYAKKNNIPSYSLLPGYISPQPFLSEWFKVNKIFVHGLDGRDSMLKLNYNKNRLEITGNPKYDFLKTINTDESKKIINKKFGLNVKKPLIVIAMSRWWNNDEIWISDFIKYCNKNSFEVIVKIHPVYKSDARELSDKKISEIKKTCLNEKYTISYDGDLSKILSAADLVITDFSNVGIEAILLDKSLLTVNFSNESFEYVLRYHEYGSSIYLQKYDDLEKIVKEIIVKKMHLNDLAQGRKKIIELVNYQNDGKASERIFNFITKKTEEISFE